MKATQLSLLEESKEEILERKIELLEKELANTRKGLFGRFDELKKMVLDMKLKREGQQELWK